MAKGGTIWVEIALDKDQFDKDMKTAAREISAVQKQLSMEMERNKVKFAVEGLDKNTGWAEKLFGSTVIGKIQQAKKEVEFLNTQIGYQRNKVDIAKQAWEGITASKGALSLAAVSAEKAFLREQMSLVGLSKQLDSTATASNLMAGALKSAAMTAVAAAVAIGSAYATLVKAANEWGNAVNDLVDETGLADEEASRLLGTMNIIGMSAEDGAAAIAKLTKNVTAAAAAQTTANKAGKDSEDVFTKYGIAIRDADGVLLDHTTIIQNIQSVHGEMADGLKKTSMEMELFGKSGYKMKDFLDLTKEQMIEFGKAVDKTGATLKDSAKYEEFQRQINLLQVAFKGMAVTIVGDDIPALQQMTKELAKTAEWIKENKSVFDDLKSGVVWGVEQILKPIEIMGKGVKQYIEYRNELNKYQQEKQPKTSETDFVQRQQTSVKNANEIAKKAAEIEAARVDALKETKQAQQELNVAILQLQGKTLAAQLINIETEKKAWIKKTQDEVTATKWAEAAKTKAYEDAIDARLGAEVAAAKEAIKNGKDVAEAIRVASEARKADEKITYDAQKSVKDYYGIKAPGDTQSKLVVDAVNGLITQVKSLVTEWSMPKDKYGKTVMDKYEPPPPGKVEITVTSNVNVNGMDKQSAQQLGEVAAAEIIPQVQQAIADASTRYGGGA